MLVGAICLHLGGLKAARLLHYEFLDNIVRLPMTFFDTTPVGRILNRFSRDIDVMDKDISMHYDWVLRCSTMVVSIIFVIAYSTPSFLLGLFPIAVLYLFIQVSWIKIKLKCVGISKSPVGHMQGLKLRS